MVKLHESASAVLSADQQHTAPSQARIEDFLSLPASSQKDNFHLERNLRQHGYSVIAGLDEVGRGPLAGPVVAAAVILPEECNHSLFLDSKKLTAKKRQFLFKHLREIPARIGIGTVSHQTIDKINILQASLLAMQRAVEELATQDHPPDFLLVDGKFPVPVATPQQPLVKGENRSASIAAASIVAKVTRDQLMVDLHQKFPCYNFQGNKGYPTREHRQAVKEHGISPYHRLSFKGVKEVV